MKYNEKQQVNVTEYDGQYSVCSKILILLTILQQPGNICRIKTTSLKSYVEETGHKINTIKTEVMIINTILSEPIAINNNLVESVYDFSYFGSVINADNDTKKDIKTRFSKAR